MLGFGALAMTALAIEVGPRKREKAKGPRESEKILLGYYIKLGPESQESCVYLRIVQLRHGKPMNWIFGIKSFYPKIGGMCLHQNLGEEHGNSQASKIVLIKKSIE